MKKGGHGLLSSVSQAQLDTRMKQKVHSATGSAHQHAKKVGGVGSIGMTSSASVSHFKSPSQQFQSKKSAHPKNYPIWGAKRH